MKTIHAAVLPPILLSLGVVAFACADYSADGQPDASGSTTTSGSTATGDTTTTSGGTTSGGGSTTTAGGTTSTTGGGLPPNTATMPCDILQGAGLPCVSAHSTVRRIVSGYEGPLYQVCKGTAEPGPGSCKGETLNIGAVDGYGDAAAQDAFCAGATCTISMIFDQSGMGNDLEPAPPGGAKPSPDDPARADTLPVTINGRSAYGVWIRQGMGYRTGCNGCTIKEGLGTAVGDEPQTMYMVTSQHDLVDGCCFNYGNAETTSNNDGNGTMEAVYFGGGVVWGTGAGGKPGPWVMADMEDGLYAGWENGQDQNISTNIPMLHDFVTAIVVGDTADKNNGLGRFALYGGDAQAGELTELWDGIRPEKVGYVPMQKQGSIILGTGGDNSASGAGRFYEGVMSNGVADRATLDALQAAIVAAGYANPD